MRSVASDRRTRKADPVVFQYSSDTSSGLTVVRVEQATEPFTSQDSSCGAFWNTVDQSIAKALVRSLKVIVCHVLLDRSPKMVLAEEHKPVQTFGLDREDEPFGVGVQIRAPRRQPN